MANKKLFLITRCYFHRNSMENFKEGMAYALVITDVNEQFEDVQVIHRRCLKCDMQRDDWYPDRIGMDMWFCSSCRKFNILTTDLSVLRDLYHSMITQDTKDYINQRHKRLDYVDLRTNDLYISFHPEVTQVIESHFEDSGIKPEIVANYIE